MSNQPFEAYPAATVNIDVSTSSQRVLAGPSATPIRVCNAVSVLAVGDFT